MSKTLFNHLDAIFTNQARDYFDILDDGDKKTYNPFMMNRLVSMNLKYVPLVNEFQKYLGIITSRVSYLFYSQSLPKGKQFNKYIKSAKSNTYDELFVDLVVRYYEVSSNEAIEYLDLFFQTDVGKAKLREICEFFGTDPKLIKKAKL